MATKKPTKKSSNVEPPIPAPPRGSRSMRGPARISTPTTPSYAQKMADIRAADKVEYQRRVASIKATHAAMRKAANAEFKKYNLTPKGTAKNNAKAQNPGRAQPKGTAPRTATPRTPSALPARSGARAGGGSSMYSRITGGGLRSHGR